MEIGPIIVDCASVPDPDLGTVECICHLRLAARERGAEVRLENVGPRLRELLAFCGLSVQVERQPE